MDAIKDIIQDLIQELKTSKPLKDDPEILLKKVLSLKERGHVRFRYFKHGILGIAVDSSTWLYQLNLQKRRLLARLAKKSSGIKDIRFYIGDTS
jgi:hypothetical protein